MLVMKSIPLKLFEDKAEVFLLKRSFDLSNLMPTTFRELEYPDHKNKSLEKVYPFIGCFVILKNQNFWIRFLTLNLDGREGDRRSNLLFGQDQDGRIRCR